MRILLVTEFLPPRVSGIAERCRQYKDGYRKRGHHVTTWCVEGTVGGDRMMPSIPNPKNPDQRIALFCPSLLWSLATEPWDVVHIFTPGNLNTLPILLIAKVRGIRIYASYHVNLVLYGTTYFSPIVAAILYVVFQLLYHSFLSLLVDVIGLPSLAPLTDFLIPPRSVHIMGCGVDSDKFHPMDPQLREEKLINEQNNFYNTALTSTTRRKRMLYVGRLAPEKDIEFLLDAFSNPNVQEYLEDFELIIVGDGPWRGVLDKKVAEMKKEFTSRIHFTGVLHNDPLVEQYQLADVFVTASPSETFGFTNAEAMACGVPVVCVNAGAFPESYSILLEKGHMFNSGDQEAYAKLCWKLVQRGEEAREEAIRIVREKYSWDSTVDDMLVQYRGNKKDQ